MALGVLDNWKSSYWVMRDVKGHKKHGSLVWYRPAARRARASRPPPTSAGFCRPFTLFL